MGSSRFKRSMKCLKILKSQIIRVTSFAHYQHYQSLSHFKVYSLSALEEQKVLKEKGSVWKWTFADARLTQGSDTLLPL